MSQSRLRASSGARGVLGSTGSRPPAPPDCAVSGGCVRGASRRLRCRRAAYSSPILSAAMKASCGIDTDPYSRIRFFPSFCLSRSLRLRLMSPP